MFITVITIPSYIINTNLGNSVFIFQKLYSSRQSIINQIITQKKKEQSIKPNLGVISVILSSKNKRKFLSLFMEKVIFPIVQQHGFFFPQVKRKEMNHGDFPFK